MTDLIYKIIEETNPGQFILHASVVLWVYFNLNKKIELGFKETTNAIHDLDKRLVRVETLLHTQDCCMLKNEIKEKAE